MKKILIATLLLSGCADATNIKLPSFEIPKWQESKKPALSKVDHEWWKSFGDEKLNALIEKAKKQSPDAKIALARVKQARASEEETVADQLPLFSAGAGAERDKLSQTLTSRPVSRKYSNNFSADFDASWEVNPFALDAALSAASAYSAEAEMQYNNALVTLAGDVARNYFEIIKTQKQIAVAEKNIADEADVVGLTDSLVKAGKVSGADKSSAETLLANSKAALPPLKNHLAETTYALQILLGEKPGALEVADNKLEDKDFEVATPAAVLAERPDIKAAEEQVKYTGALKDVAFDQYYPSVSITGLLGFESGKASKLLNGKSSVASLAGGITAPIFDFGRIKAQVKNADAGAEEALAAYEKTVLAAFAEVESALNAIENERAHYNALQDAYASSKLSFDLANERYKHGLDPYLNVLDAQRSVNQNEQLLAISKADILINKVRLYKALGGGWKNK